MANITKLPVTIIRGGTSKGVYILEDDLPADKAAWEPLLLRLMGSPDKKQIDGLGGSQSVTSKVAIVKKSDHPGADVDYTFAQVSITDAKVDWNGNCGNISSGVAPFAIDESIVRAGERRASSERDAKHQRRSLANLLLHLHLLDARTASAAWFG